MGLTSLPGLACTYTLDSTTASLAFEEQREPSGADYYSLLICAIYYALWVWILPYLGHYRIRHEKQVLEGGEITHKLIKVPLEELTSWDRSHDAQGRRVDSGRLSDDASPSDEDVKVDLKNEDLEA